MRQLLYTLAVALIGCGYAGIASAAPVITAQGILAFTNAERYARGLPIYTVNDQLSAIASQKMSDMFANQYFAHESPTGETIGDLADRNGYRYLTVGENLALGDFSSSKDVVDAWMNSPGHRKNILHETFTEIGIAAGRGMYEGRTVWILVQEFGLPRSICPAPNDALKKDIQSEERVLAYLKRVVDSRKKTLDATPLSSRELLTERLVAANKAVEVYNARVAPFRAQVEAYNKTVDRFNKCVQRKTDGGSR